MLNTKAKVLFAVLLLLGAGAATAIVAYSGVDDVVALLGSAGAGLLVVVPWALLPMVFAAASWRLLFAPDRPPPPFRLLVATWLGLAVNWLLPVAQIGGQVVKARWVIQRGSPRLAATASVVVDQTLLAASQILFALVGLAAMMAVVGETQATLRMMAGSLVFAVLIIVFYRLQRTGLFAVFSRAARRIVPTLHRSGWDDAAASLDDRLLALYRDRRRILASLGLRCCFRVLMTGEVWLVMMMLGHPVSLAEALVIESLTQLARAAAFLIPGALGAQEGALVLVSGALGVGPDVAVALAAAKRLREVCVGIPGLIVWQVGESGALHRMLRRVGS